jgi:hypothetical protein
MHLQLALSLLHLGGLYALCRAPNFMKSTQLYRSKNKLVAFKTNQVRKIVTLLVQKDAVSHMIRLLGSLAYTQNILRQN